MWAIKVNCSIKNYFRKYPWGCYYNKLLPLYFKYFTKMTVWQLIMYKDEIGTRFRPLSRPKFGLDLVIEQPKTHGLIELTRGI